jgi:hypothetical protein
MFSSLRGFVCLFSAGQGLKSIDVAAICPCSFAHGIAMKKSGRFALFPSSQVCFSFIAIRS